MEILRTDVECSVCAGDLRFHGEEMIAEVLKEDFYSFEEMARILGLKPATLKQRIYNGTDHPPYSKILGQYVFPTDEFRMWAKKKPLTFEVRSA